MYFWKKSILVQIVGSFLILSLITILIVGYTTFSLARASLKESVFDCLNFAIKLKENELNNWILDQHRSILAISELPEINKQAKILKYFKTISVAAIITGYEYEGIYHLLNDVHNL